MAVVLGIDAAWTPTQPSGVAVLRGSRRGWRCLALAPSYASFLELARGERVDWRARPAPALPDGAALLDACLALAGAEPDAIAIDMPLSTLPITGRRAADNAISRAWGNRGLGAHTPSADRPGAIADTLRAALEARGYALATATTPPGTPRSFLEVFPHAAAIELTGASYRVPYKLSRIAQYWPALDAAQRRRALLARWTAIRRGLAAHVRDVELRIPRTGPLAQLKRYEDALDAVICAYVAARYLAGHARPHGDATAAVWA